MLWNASRWRRHSSGLSEKGGLSLAGAPWQRLILTNRRAWRGGVWEEGVVRWGVEGGVAESLQQWARAAERRLSFCSRRVFIYRARESESALVSRLIHARLCLVLVSKLRTRAKKNPEKVEEAPSAFSTTDSSSPPTAGPGTNFTLGHLDWRRKRVFSPFGRILAQKDFTGKRPDLLTYLHWVLFGL